MRNSKIVGASLAACLVTLVACKSNEETEVAEAEEALVELKIPYSGKIETPPAEYWNEVIGVGGGAGGKFGGRSGGKKKVRSLGGGVASSPGPAGPATPGPAPPGAGIDFRGLGAQKDNLADGDDSKAATDALDFFVPGSALTLDEEVERCLVWCRPLPNERPDAMYFRFWGDNPFERTALDKLSTFSVDVDTASYALARSYLNEGNLPTKAQIRTEEFVNYFRPDVPAPTTETFHVETELAPSRFGSPEHELLRVVVRGREVHPAERAPLALTFVVDTSGSMKRENRMGMVKHSLRLLATQLGARDAVSIVAFSNEARLVLPMTSAGDRAALETAIHGLAASGGTNAEAGLLLGYAQATTALDPQATNRVILLSDGVANIGETDQDRINGSVAAHRDRGIYLNTVGVGMGNHNDVFLEQLADKGDGICNYIDTPVEARRTLVDNFTGAFEPIARDVKIQVEFDPAQVESYRLLGYENRAIADADFRNDEVDAGEVGAGHQVAALYELVHHPIVADAPLATVRLRWKAPHGQVDGDAIGETARELEHPVAARDASGSYAGTTAGYRRSVLVAQFAELLRGSQHAEGDTYADLLTDAEALAPELRTAEFDEFVGLVRRSSELALGAEREQDALEEVLERVRHNEYRRALHAELEGEEHAALVLELEAEGRELEARVREVLEARRN